MTSGLKFRQLSQLLNVRRLRETRHRLEVGRLLVQKEQCTAQWQIQHSAQQAQRVRSDEQARTAWERLLADVPVPGTALRRYQQECDLNEAEQQRMARQTLQLESQREEASDNWQHGVQIWRHAQRAAEVIDARLNRLRQDMQRADVRKEEAQLEDFSDMRGGRLGGRHG